LFRGFPVRVLEAEITGVSEALANLTERGALDPVVKAVVTLSESGFVTIDNAVAFGDIKDESLSGSSFISLVFMQKFQYFVKQANSRVSLGAHRPQMKIRSLRNSLRPVKPNKFLWSLRLLSLLLVQKNLQRLKRSPSCR
jgi:hypothetical protein